MSTGTIEVRLTGAAQQAEGISVFELRPLSGERLPVFSAGSHIDVLLPNGLTRSYSLTNSQAESHRYVIAVNRDAASRGGSKFIHESWKVGEIVRIAGPRNNFRLVEDARHVVFIAGGIGITPLWSMIQRLEALGRSWELHYTARTHARAAFLREIQEISGAHRVRFNFDQEPGGKLLDVQAIVAATAPDAHLYCCGPAPLLAAFHEATKPLPATRVHFEYFASAAAPAGGGFTVVLARTGEAIAIPDGKSILDTLLERGLDVPHSCTQGVCGSCETRVLDGIPDHKDCVMTDEERKANKTMMICCSGSKSDKLVLDL